MSDPITILVRGIPKGQPRPRAFAFHGRARVYDPGTAEAWKSEIALAARPYVPREPIAGPVSLVVCLWFPRPKSHYLRGAIRASAPAMYVSKPDVDNAVKAVMDALTAIGMWRDDAQVCSLCVSKMYTAGDAKPGAMITIQDRSV